ncbi:MAG TPA: hypothetical protein VM367_10145 [Pseudonocardia sp.]|nr:hypothetical protein [Pseudonocardia sp.]
MFTAVRIDAPTRTSFARAGALSTVGLLAQGFLRFAAAFLVGRIAGGAELGVLASAIATATILSLLWPTTTGSAASKFLAGARGAADRAEVSATAAHLRRRTVETTTLLASVSVPVWLLLDGGSWAGAASVAALTVAYSGYSFTRGVQFGVGQVPRAIGWDVTSVALGLAALAALLLAGVRGPALVLSLVLAYAAYTVAGWPYGVAGRPARQRRRELDGFVALGVIGSLASTGFLQLSQIAARLVGGDAAAGQYAAALYLATPASMLAASLSLVLLPSLAETWGRGDERGFHAQTDRAMRAFSVLVVGIFGSIVLCSRALVELVWGAEFSRAADLLPVLVAAVLATNLGVVSVNALTSRSRRGMRLTMSASLVGMTVGVTVWLVAGTRMGIDAIALGYLCGTVVIAAAVVVAAWRSGRHAWGPLFGKIALGVAVFGAIAAVQRLADLPVLLDPVLAIAFLAAWWLLNRAEVARLPRPWSSRRR